MGLADTFRDLFGHKPDETYEWELQYQFDDEAAAMESIGSIHGSIPVVETFNTKGEALTRGIFLDNIVGRTLIHISVTRRNR